MSMAGVLHVTMISLVTLSLTAATAATKPATRPTTRPRPSFSVDRTPPNPKAKYEPSTPEADAKAIDQARKSSQAVQQELNLKLDEVQTAHFIVFTDWDPREAGFLKTNLEAAYAAVSRQFDIPVKEN